MFSCYMGDHLVTALEAIWYLCSRLTKGYNLDESKVLQYFGNMRHGLIAIDAFAKIQKMMNHAGKWDTKLTFVAKIMASESIALSLPDLVWSSKFLQPSGYHTAINSAFTFYPANIFGCISNVMFQFKLEMNKLHEIHQLLEV